MSNNGNKVFYGEYTLKHWINLILKKDIVLPEYQRYFVWDLDKAKRLIQSIKNNEFIPPVTIGALKNSNGKTENLIIDGQQRLTSILLAYLGFFPNKRGNYAKAVKFIDENDKQDLDENDNQDSDIKNNGNPTKINELIEWKFTDLLENGTNREELRKYASNINDNKYVKFDEECLSDEDLDCHYLGFCYLVPDDKSQQKYYSIVFRNINIQGQSLTPLEARESLYYWHNEYTEFFHPKCINDIKIHEERIDFVRYLSLLSQYAKRLNISKKGTDGTTGLAYGYARHMEDYYEKYIKELIDEIENDNSESESVSESMFLSLKQTLGSDKFEDRISKLGENIKKLNLDKRQYPSIIDLDISLFGLIYRIIFKNKEIDPSEVSDITDQIGEEITSIKTNNFNHKSNPAAITHLKTRIKTSLKIYGELSDE